MLTPKSKTAKRFRPSAIKTNKSWYFYIHNWIKKHKPLPEICEWCGRKSKLQYANLSFEYKKEIDDWACICIICHHSYDSGSNSANKKMKYLNKTVLEFLLEDTRSFLRIYRRIQVFKKERLATILIEHYVKGKTFKTLGTTFNISTERVRQIARRGLYKLSNLYIREKDLTLDNP